MIVRLLTAATLVYAGVLVLALVVVLSTIGVQLWLISRALRDTKTALAGVATGTASLRDHLSGVTTLIDRNVSRIEEATRGLERPIDAALDRSARRPPRQLMGLAP